MHPLEWDRELYRAVNVGMHHPAYDRFWLLVTYTGDGWQALVLLFGCLFPGIRRVSLACLASWALSGMLRLPVAILVARARPSNFWWAQPLEPVFNDKSFPSGHTTTSFAIAVCIALSARGSRHGWVGLVALAWGCAVGFSRVYVGVHYPGDVVGGMALGTASAALVHSYFGSRGWLESITPGPPTTPPSSGSETPA